MGSAEPRVDMAPKTFLVFADRECSTVSGATCVPSRSIVARSVEHLDGVRAWDVSCAGGCPAALPALGLLRSSREQKRVRGYFPRLLSTSISQHTANKPILGVASGSGWEGRSGEFLVEDAPPPHWLASPRRKKPHKETSSRGRRGTGMLQGDASCYDKQEQPRRLTLGVAPSSSCVSRLPPVVVWCLMDEWVASAGDEPLAQTAPVRLCPRPV